jgi:multiple sugar transport system substrate-binding protein
MKKAIFLCTILFLLIFLVSPVFAMGEQEDTEGKTIVKYTRWAGTEEAEDFQKLIDKFNAENPDIEVVAEFLPWNAYWEKLRTSILSGDAADIISLSQIQAGPYLTKGAFLKLDDLPGAQDLLDQMLPGGKVAVMFEGNIYAMPVGAGVRAMIYNKALLDAAGIPYPSPTEPMTWDEFFEIGEQLTVFEDGEIVQHTAYFHYMEIWESFVNQMGGRLMDDYTKPTEILINTPEGIAGLQLIVDLIENNVIPPYTGDWQTAWGSPDSAVVTGKVVFMQTGPWAFGPLYEAGIDFGTTPLPVGEERANRGYINSLAIFKDSEVVDEAWRFIQWICGVEGQLEFTLTGDLPANLEALDEAKANDPRGTEIMEAYFSEQPYVITGPMLPSAEFNSLLDTVLTQLFQLQITPEEAAARIEEEGQLIIEKMYE